MLQWLGLFAALWSESHGYAASAFLSTFQRDTKTSNGMLAMAFNGFFIFGYVFNCESSCFSASGQVLTYAGYSCRSADGRYYRLVMLKRSHYVAYDSQAPLEYEKAWYGVMELLDSIKEAGANWDGTAALTIKPVRQILSLVYFLLKQTSDLAHAV